MIAECLPALQALFRQFPVSCLPALIFTAFCICLKMKLDSQRIRNVFQVTFKEAKKSRGRRKAGETVRILSPWHFSRFASLDMVAPIYNPSTQGAESKSLDILSYKVRLCLKT